MCVVGGSVGGRSRGKAECFCGASKDGRCTDQISTLLRRNESARDVRVSILMAPVSNAGSQWKVAGVPEFAELNR